MCTNYIDMKLHIYIVIPPTTGILKMTADALEPELDDAWLLHLP